MGKGCWIVRCRKVVSVMLGLAVVVAAAGCTDGDDDDAKPKAKPPAKVALVQFGPADVVSPTRAIRPLDDATSKVALDVVQRVFDATVFAPLTTGRAGSITRVFTTEAATQATTVDRATLFDEGVRRVTKLEADAQVVLLTGFADDADQLMVVVAKFVWDVTGDGGRVHLVRTGELTLTPAFGSWFVSAYEVTNTRTVQGVSSTTTAVKS